MDLANLQIKITQVGTQAALNKLDKLATATGNLEDKLDSLSKKTRSNGALNKGLREYGESARLAAIQLKSLADTANSLGVGRLSDLIAATKKLRQERVALAQDEAKIIKAEELSKQARLKTAEARIIAFQHEREGAAKLARDYKKTQAEVRLQDEKTATERKRGAAITTAANAQILNTTRLTNAQIGVSNQKLAVQNQNLATQQVRHSAAVQHLAAAQSNAAAAQHKHSTAIGQSTTNWIAHAKSVAGGIVLYQAIRSVIFGVVDAVSAGIKAVSDFQTDTIQLAATIASISNIPDPFRAYKLASTYAKNLVPTLEQVDRYTVLNFDHLMLMTQEFAKQGILLDSNNKKQVESFTRIANAVALYSRNGEDSRQVQQEIAAVLRGQVRDSDRLAKLLDSITDGTLRRQIEEWKKQGTVIENLGNLLKGFGPALQDLETSWATVTSSLQTTFNILARETLTPLMETWSKQLLDFNNGLINNSTEITNWSRVGLIAMQQVGNAAYEMTTQTVDLIGKMTYAAAKSFGIDLPKELDFLGNKWQITAGVIAGAMNFVVESLIETKYYLLQVTNGLLTLNGVAAALLTGQFGSIPGIYDNGSKESGRLNAEKSKELAKARKDYEEAMQYESFDPKKQKDAETLKKEFEELLNSMRNQMDGVAGGGRKGKGGTSDYEKRSTLLEKWNGELNKELAAQHHIKDVSEVLNAIEEKNIALRQKNLTELLPNEISEIARKTTALIKAKRVTEEMNAMYEFAIANERKMLSVKDAAARMKEKYPELNDRFDRYVRISEREYENKTNPISEYVQKLKDERGAIGLVNEELELYESNLQIVNMLLDQGYNLTDQATQSLIQQAAAEKKLNVELKKRADQDLWLQMKNGTRSFLEGYSGTLNDMLWGSKKTFGEILEEFLKMLTEIIIQTQIVKPLINSVFGNRSGANTALDSLLVTSPGLFAKGAAFESGSVVPFANGGAPFARGGFVTNIPTIFPMARGGIGIMSEFGQNEAVMPLARTRSGNLGVETTGGSAAPNVRVNIVNNTGAQIEERREENFDGETYVITTFLSAVANNKGGTKDILKSQLKN